MNIKFSTFALTIILLPANFIYTANRASTKQKYDLTVIGNLNFADGLGRLSIGIIDSIADKAKVNYIASNDKLLNLKNIPKKILKKIQPIVTGSDKSPGKVALLCDLLWHTGDTPSNYVPNSHIKIAYSMIESTLIPDTWVKILNNNFDAVIVPDTFLVEVYANSGVQIPIFVLPIGLYLEEFLQQPIKHHLNKPFTFGLSAGFWPRKNQDLLIDAFIQEFGDNPGVQLLLQGRFGDNNVQKDITEKIAKSKAPNIKFINKIFTQHEYINFMKSLDCYAFLSQGEGFSITPREALALGIPCIITNNTAHKTICDTGLVNSVPAEQLVPAYYKNIFNKLCGFHFNCTLHDAKKALREVYQNYSLYLQKAHKARNWVKQYSQSTLKNKYLTLCKPTKVILSNNNSIEEGIIITNSKNLYEKYKAIVPKNSYDVTVIGVIKFADGLGRLPIGAIDTLKNKLKMNFITSRHDNYMNLNDVPKSIRSIAKDPNKIAGNISLFFDLPWLTWDSPYKFVPNSPIKIAYSMVESDAVPVKWVEILNTAFDAIVVPDQFLVSVYQKSGITKPVFVMPHGIYIEKFLDQPIKKQKNKPFVFGNSAGFWQRKNQACIVEAFAQEFGNNQNVILKLHGRLGEKAQKKQIRNIISKYKLTTIEFIDKSLDETEYLNFMRSLDCYVLLSKGEGFSVTPREALALGIPCIISNNTAHKTICDTGFVKEVEANLLAPAYYSHIKEYAGNDYNCTTEQARKALRDVYDNYEKYLKKAHQGREWVKQYLYKNLKHKYVGLLKPQKIILSDYNSIENNCLITNSTELYNKYINILQN